MNNPLVPFDEMTEHLLKNVPEQLRPRCLAMADEFGEKVCSLREGHAGPHEWVTPVRTTGDA